MTSCEQFALQQLLGKLKPANSIEVGTYKGGSLQVLSALCAEVDSIDIDPTVSKLLAGQFSNVNFHTGNSSELLPELLEGHTAKGKPVGFVLIDGDHSTEGVRRDINAILSVKPQTTLLVLMHDAFNPGCRQGILTAAWKECPFVHELEVDWIPGVYHEHAYDTAAPRTMWGGFALALLKPEARPGPLMISERQRGLFEAVYKVSSHTHSPHALLRRFKGRLRSAMARAWR
jgi:hypothetical protein